MNNNFVICIVGLPGAGKTTLIKEFIKLDQNIHRIITSTSREKRPGEVEGKDYNFFKKNQISLRNHFQISEVNSNLYGTLSSELCATNIVALTKDGIDQYRKQKNITLFIYHLECDERICKKRMISRGDNIRNIDSRIQDDKIWLSKIQPDIKIQSTENNPKFDANILYKVLKYYKLI